MATHPCFNPIRRCLAAVFCLGTSRATWLPLPVTKINCLYLLLSGFVTAVVEFVMPLGLVFEEKRSERLCRILGDTLFAGACFIFTDVCPSSSLFALGVKFLELLGAAELSPTRVSVSTKLDDDI